MDGREGGEWVSGCNSGWGVGEWVKEWVGSGGVHERVGGEWVSG